MKKDITVWQATRRSDKLSPAFCIQFIYKDLVLAQRVTQELAARFITSNLESNVLDQKAGVGGVTIQMLDPGSPCPSARSAQGFQR